MEVWMEEFEELHFMSEERNLMGSGARGHRIDDLFDTTTPRFPQDGV